jgi:hypothetical protein
VEKSEVKDNFEDLSAGGRIILKYILESSMRQCGLGSPGFGYGQIRGFCEHGSETSGYIKWGGGGL